MCNPCKTRSNTEWVDALKQDGCLAQEQAFNDLFIHLYRVVYTYMRKRAATLPGLQILDEIEWDALARDFVQEASVTIYQKLEQYEGKGSFCGWTAIIVINIARKEFVRARWQDISSDQPFACDWIDCILTQDQQAMVREIMMIIEQAIEGNLTKRQRVVFLLRFVHGYSYKDIVNLLNEGDDPDLKDHDIRWAQNAAFEACQKIKKYLLTMGYRLDETVEIFKNQFARQ